MPNDDQGAREFVSVLLELNKGRPHAELTDGLAAVIRSVVDTGNAGQLKLTIGVKPAKGDDSQVDVTALVDVKLARHDPARTVFYVDELGRPSRNDPNQGSFFGVVNDVPALQTGEHHHHDEE